MGQLKEECKEAFKTERLITEAHRVRDQLSLGFPPLTLSLSLPPWSDQVTQVAVGK